MVVFGAGPSDRDRVNLVAELRTRVSASTPIVVLADDDSASQRARFIWAGASTYIVKPAHGCDVESTIGLLLEVASTR
jgi:DNA-binding response OmpR family regulator